jgi:dihydrofolate reductase
MRKIIVSMHMSLDGVIEEPAWSKPFWDDEITKYKRDELFSSGAILLGRVTYQGYAEIFPSRIDANGYAEKINALPKFVVSDKLKKVEWSNSTLISKNVMRKIEQLKRQPGKDLLVFGSSDLVDTLMQYDLIDEYRLLVYPVVLGSGKHLFKDWSKATFNLVDTRTFDCGVVAMTYLVDRRKMATQ